jgi:hypothetical protein
MVEHSTDNRATVDRNHYREPNVSRWCNGSMSVSKTVGRGSSPWRDAKYGDVA